MHYANLSNLIHTDSSQIKDGVKCLHDRLKTEFRQHNITTSDISNYISISRTTFFVLTNKKFT